MRHVPAVTRWMLGALALLSALTGSDVPVPAAAAQRQVDTSPVTPASFGAACDSTGANATGTDDTIAFQKAIDLAEETGRRLKIPGLPTMCRLTAPLRINRHLIMEGDYCQPVRRNDGVAATPGLGSWLYFDHPGRGIEIGDGARSQVTGVVLADFCTIRNQPPLANGGTWTASDNDFDIYFAQDDLIVRNLMLLNPTKGLFASGRLEVQGLHGQPMAVGLQLDAVFDTARVSDVHFWPYWADNKPVEAFTRANLDAIVLGRVDNPEFINLSAVYPHNCIRLVQGAKGAPNKVHGVNIDCDLFGNYAWLVDGTAGATWQVVNLTGQGDDQTLSQNLVGVAGRGNVGTFVNTRGTLIGRDGVTVNGSDNDVTFVNLRLERWGRTVAAPAVSVAASNAVTISGAFQTVDGPKGAPAVGGTGAMRHPPTIDLRGTPAPAGEPSPGRRAP